MTRKSVSLLVALFIFSYSYLFATTPTENSKSLSVYIESNYSSLIYDGVKPDFELFKKGLIGYLNLKKENKLSDSGLLTLIDFRLSSNKKRLWIIDLKSHKVIYHSLVAHGRNTGNEFATNFSNVPESNTSSIGFYITGETYHGKHGLSLRLDGVESGFNNNARKRAIVMHGADYVDKSFTKAYGRMGRSFGCPSIPMKDHEKIVKQLANKSCLFIYYPDQDYLSKSRLIREEAVLDVLTATNYLVI